MQTQLHWSQQELGTQVSRESAHRSSPGLAVHLGVLRAPSALCPFPTLWNGGRTGRHTWLLKCVSALRSNSGQRWSVGSPAARKPQLEENNPHRWERKSRKPMTTAGGEGAIEQVWGRRRTARPMGRIPVLPLTSSVTSVPQFPTCKMGILTVAAS